MKMRSCGCKTTGPWPSHVLGLCVCVTVGMPPTAGSERAGRRNTVLHPLLQRSGKKEPSVGKREVVFCLATQGISRSPKARETREPPFAFTKSPLCRVGRITIQDITPLKTQLSMARAFLQTHFQRKKERFPFQMKQFISYSGSRKCTEALAGI